MNKIRELKYSNKMDSFKSKTLFSILTQDDQKFLEKIGMVYSFTFQEFRLMTVAARDLQMWQEGTFQGLWLGLEEKIPETQQDTFRKKKLLKALAQRLQELKKRPKTYPEKGLRKSPRKTLKLISQESNKKIFGDCPVASPKTVCCNLKTIDAVENCAFGCSYCTIETFYGDQVIFDKNLGEKLKKIQLDPDRFYHIGTGQSSDSLVWGNREGILDDLCEFARKHPNVLLEFKTKSSNIAYFLENEIPPNIVCSWSLNTDPIVNNEEHFTSSLEKRLEAARKLADRGIGVAFHFHPIVYYEGWEVDYPVLAGKIQKIFQPHEVLFISFGAVTFIKPIIQEIRRRGDATKILQMEMVPDPHGKLTYPDPIKLQLFRAMDQAFKPWENQVFKYLCMERAEIWDQVFGWHYPTNEIFEQDFGKKVMGKIRTKINV